MIGLVFLRQLFLVRNKKVGAGRGGAAARGRSRGVFRAHPVETPGDYSLQVLILPFLFLFECLLIQYVIRLSCIALCREATSFWWKCYNLVEMYSSTDPAPDCQALYADPDPDFTKWCWSYRIQIHNIIKCSLRRVEMFMDLDSRVLNLIRSQ